MALINYIPKGWVHRPLTDQEKFVSYFIAHKRKSFPITIPHILHSKEQDQPYELLLKCKKCKNDYPSLVLGMCSKCYHKERNHKKRNNWAI